MAVIAYAGTHAAATLVEAGAGPIVHALPEIRAAMLRPILGAAV